MTDLSYMITRQWTDDSPQWHKYRRNTCRNHLHRISASSCLEFIINWSNCISIISHMGRWPVWKGDFLNSEKRWQWEWQVDNIALILLPSSERHWIYNAHIPETVLATARSLLHFGIASISRAEWIKITPTIKSTLVLVKIIAKNNNFSALIDQSSG